MQAIKIVVEQIRPFFQTCLSFPAAPFIQLVRCLIYLRGKEEVAGPPLLINRDRRLTRLFYKKSIDFFIIELTHFAGGVG